MLRSLPLVVAAATLAGCGGGELTAHLAAPPVAVSPADALRTLHFVAVAHTTDRIADGEVDVAVHVNGDGENAGQVRVTVGRAEHLGADPAPRDDVVSCHADASLMIPSAALTGCDGLCRQPFTVVLAAEGMAAGTSVTLPVVVDARLAYETALQAPAGDTLELTLE